MDILITDDIRNHWIFKDDRKFKWWVELNLMADENGEVHMSLSDLSKHWKVDKSTVSRFLAKLSSATLCATIVQHSVQQIRLCRIESYKDVCNTLCNEVATLGANVKESPLSSPSSFSPIPPLSTPPIIPQENYPPPPPRVYAREDIAWDAGKERNLAETFKANQMVALARKFSLGRAEMLQYIEAFLDECQIGNHGHKDVGHFGNHLKNFIEDERAKPKVKQARVTTGSDILKVYNK